MKYALTDETMTFDDGIVVTRIRALRDLMDGDLPAGTPGGWVQSEANLSQEGGAWIADDAVACEGARVEGEAILRGQAVVRGRAVVRGVATVQDDAEVTDDAVIEGASILRGTSRVSGNAVIASGEDGPTLLPGTWLDFDLGFGEDHAVFGHTDGAGLLIAVSDKGRICVAGTWERDDFAGDLQGLKVYLTETRTAGAARILRAIEAYLASP